MGVQVVLEAEKLKIHVLFCGGIWEKVGCGATTKKAKISEFGVDGAWIMSLRGLRGGFMGECDLIKVSKSKNLYQ